MTEPTPEPPAETLPPVDRVIQDAREGSWQLPETPTDRAQAGHAPASGRPPTPTAGSASHGATAAAHGGSPGHSASAGSGHGSGHDAAHTEDPLGPVDVELWGAGIIAAVIGLFMTICFVIATAGVGAY